MLNGLCVPVSTPDNYREAVELARATLAAYEAAQ